MFQDKYVVTVDEIHYDDGSEGCFGDDIVITEQIGKYVTTIEVTSPEYPDARAAVCGKTPHSMSDLNIMHQDAVLRFIGCNDKALGCLLSYR